MIENAMVDGLSPMPLKGQELLFILPVIFHFCYLFKYSNSWIHFPKKILQGISFSSIQVLVIIIHGMGNSKKHFNL